MNTNDYEGSEGVIAGEAPRAGRREWIGLAVIALPCLLYSMDLTVLELAVAVLMALVVAGPAVAVSDNFNGNNGNHHGDVRNPDSGKHFGGDAGGRFH
jgi:hypothetical protein